MCKYRIGVYNPSRQHTVDPQGPTSARHITILLLAEYRERFYSFLIPLSHSQASNASTVPGNYMKKQ